MSAEAFFTTTLLDWYEPERRPLPWKHIDNPYLIWLSEIILQQTRAEQGLPYYQKFSTHYPTVSDLAEAPEDEVMKMWEGLGYYSRARNLHAAAKYVHQELGGVFPTTHEGILALKGVGPYTAAAIASFAYNLPHAVVDGNVYRVLSRYFDYEGASDTTEGKKYFAALAQRLLDEKQAGRYNQAIMDFGATVCTPKAAQCKTCPLATECEALANGTVYERPLKLKKLKRRTRYFNYLVVRGSNFRIVEKRRGKDIWQNLYQFPLVETAEEVDEWSAVLRHEGWPEWLSGDQVQLHRRLGPRKQELTHQRIIANFWELDYLADEPPQVPENFSLVKPENCRNFAFPKIIGWYFDDNLLYLF
ncbi:MAG: A/G-specific adenine glycosylase [Bacteroidota bacterium]